MKSLVAFIALMGTMAIAAPGTYVGSGSASVAGGEKQAYSAEITSEVVKGSLEAPEVVKFTETYRMGEGEAQTYVSTFHFEKNSPFFKVKRGEATIGCGYCHKLDANSWCDYRIQTEQGPLHVNLYYDHASRTIHRIGDFVRLDGVGIWTDRLVLKDEE